MKEIVVKITKRKRELRKRMLRMCGGEYPME